MVVASAALFPSDLDADLFYVAYFVWLGLSFFIEAALIGRDQRGTVRTRGDRGSTLVIYFTVVLSLVVAFVCNAAGLGILPDGVFFVGIAMMFLGILLREWAVATLRGYFSYRVRVLQDHKVVDRGPYHLIRHPAYSGSIITIVGVGVALRSWVGALLLVLFSLVAYGYRIRIEEKAMVRDLGEDYTEYMSRTKRLIPYLF